ncbi:hypothetical protein T07_2296 [Trichinella nelsoni]|uniref:Uncharacterized protein n=1 Tax=Trichinella nelsoni TaxID=6336 RepID=A0A0V0RAA2_9BILA|nr:hypothetical protein T07_2296 [Trichinella nelsoni]
MCLMSSCKGIDIWLEIGSVCSFALIKSHLPIHLM